MDGSLELDTEKSDDCSRHNHGSGDSFHTVRTGESLSHGAAHRMRSLLPTRAGWFGLCAAYAQPSEKDTHRVTDVRTGCVVSPHKPLGEPVRRPEPALSLTPTTRGTRCWGAGMTAVCLLQPPQAKKPLQSLTKTQQSSKYTVSLTDFCSESQRLLYRITETY